MNRNTLTKVYGRNATGCNAGRLELQPEDRRRVEAAFDAGRVTSDGGLLLVRELTLRSGLLRRFAACFRDNRDPSRVEHSVEELVAQRVLGIICGYEDLNDHDRLRDDAMLALAVGKDDITGASRKRQRDQGHALAGKSTLNRLELAAPVVDDGERYKKISYDDHAIERLFVGHFLGSHETAPAEIVLDLDATDDPVHGEQEGRFFQGYYGHYCYLPLYVFCGEFLLGGTLHTADVGPGKHSVEELERIVSAAHDDPHLGPARLDLRGAQAGVLGQAEDIVDAVLLAPAHEVVRAEAGERSAPSSRSRCAASTSPSAASFPSRNSLRGSWPTSATPSPWPENSPTTSACQRPDGGADGHVCPLSQVL